MQRDFCFGKDYPDKLVLSIFQCEGSMSFKFFSTKYSKRDYEYTTFYKVINDIKIGYIWDFPKDDEYNLEDVILNKYKQQLHIVDRPLKMPVYILKDGKWYQTSPDTDFILVPYGEHDHEWQNNILFW